MDTKPSVLYTISSFLLVYIAIGCASRISTLSDIKWTGKDTGIGTKINNMGYYKLYSSSPEAFIFYDDGTIVLCHEIPEDTTHYERMLWPPGCYYNEDLERWDIGATGVYRMEGDSIYANMYFRNCFHFSNRFRLYFSTELWKLKFKIVDHTTIVWKEKQYMDKEFPIPVVLNDTLLFTTASQLPPPNTEMKKKRWLWY